MKERLLFISRLSHAEEIRWGPVMEEYLQGAKGGVKMNLEGNAWGRKRGSSNSWFESAIKRDLNRLTDRLKEVPIE